MEWQEFSTRQPNGGHFALAELEKLWKTIGWFLKMSMLCTLKGPITWAGLGPVCRDLGASVKPNKNQVCDYMTTGLKIFDVIAFTGPARLTRTAKIFASEQTCSPVNCPFSLQIIKKYTGLRKHEVNELKCWKKIFFKTTTFSKTVDAKYSSRPGWLATWNTGLKDISANWASLANRASPAHVIGP